MSDWGAVHDAPAPVGAGLGGRVQAIREGGASFVFDVYRADTDRQGHADADVNQLNP